LPEEELKAKVAPFLIFKLSMTELDVSKAIIVATAAATAAAAASEAANVRNNGEFPAHEDREAE